MKPDYYVQNLEKWEITAIKEGSYILKSGPRMMYDIVYQVLRCFLLWSLQTTNSALMSIEIADQLLSRLFEEFAIWSQIQPMKINDPKNLWPSK